MEFGAQAITIGSIQIRYYGIIIVTAIVVAALLAARLAKRDGKDPDHVWGALFWAVIFGIIGARLWYILFPPISMTAGCADTLESTVCRDTAYFFNNFFNLQDGAIAIWSGGLHIFGAFLGGGLAGLLYIRANKLPVWPWLDIAGVVLPLGQAIGRWANYVNQELYGVPTGSFFGLQIPTAARVGEYRNTVEYPPDTLFHPLFLYESVWNIIVFIVLWRVWNRYRNYVKPGTIFLIYVASYAFIRFMLEFIRVEVSLVAGVNLVQIISAVVFVAALVLVIPRINEGRRKYREAPPVASKSSSARA
jgi:phosphatidylglycerol:prolipoprotein diacylglycerol transferase